MDNFLFTSESVTEGHPDKLCDQISDAVLDAVLTDDPQARVACEVAATTGCIMVMGEISTHCYVDIPAVVRDTVRRVGYTAAHGFDPDSIAVLVALDSQSPDIALGVDTGGAGDQGMVFGYATDETEAYMPLSLMLAHGLTRRLAEVRKDGTLPWLGPDGKAQATVEYKNGAPIRIDTIVVSAQHAPDVEYDEIKDGILRHVAMPVLPEALIDENTRFLINPTGRFVTGGPCGDTGLTGRKIIVDTYGGFARHGGGAFSGKDPTKVDRSAAYAARYAAKNLVAAGIAKRLEVQIAYAIGVAEPVSITLDTFGTGKLPDAKILALMNRHFDLRPAAIIERLDLCRPIYAQTAAYGHFGRNDIDLPWERLDVAQRLREKCGIC